MRRALSEDRADADATTRALFPRPVPARAVVVAQARGVLSGGALALAAAREARLRATVLRRDGAAVVAGTRVLALSGDLRQILAVERTLLNLLMHLSGVATRTRDAVRAARGGHRPLAVYATRKTLPGLRDAEKQAVRDGGGHAHRRDLSDQLLVKNNHLAYLGIAEAVARARRASGVRKYLEVEVRTTREALAAASAGADALLLDNQTPARARRIVEALERAGLRERIWVELSGGLSPETLGRFRRVGADAASLGTLTHSAPALPFHLTVSRATRSHEARRAP